MSFLQIAPDVLINTDQITGVKIITDAGQKMVVIRAGGENFIASMEFEELLASLKSLGVTTQFWAGR